MAVGEDPLDLLLKPPVGGSVGYVCLIARAATAGEQGDNTASPVEDDGTGISWGREGAMQLVVGQEGDLNGYVLDTVVGVDTSERLQPVDTTDGVSVVRPFFTKRRALSPWMSRCWG